VDYKQTLEYLFNALPAYHRIGAAAYKADLSNTEAMMEYLEHPENRFKSIHIAGTNGKGSVSHFLASILQSAGLKVGLYTSPHLVDFRERIRINGEMIPQQRVVDFVERHHLFFERQALSFFEMTVGMAFDYFASEAVDIAVVEVGMGGRLDSTNVITPLLSVITNIGFDHTQFLGDTLPKIAAEKAGIIKKGIPVVIGESHDETRPVFEARAARCQSPIIFADEHYLVSPKGDDTTSLLFDIHRDGTLYATDITSPMAGSYQLKNIATLTAAVDVLRERCGFHIDGQAFSKGIADVIALTGLHGRWEKVADKPLTIAETAHNADGIATLVDKLTSMRYRHLHIVYGCVNDKDYGKILRMLPDDASYYYTRPSVERGLPADILAQSAASLGKPGPVFPDVHAAVAHARASATDDDLVIVTGSIFLVADLFTTKQ